MDNSDKTPDTSLSPAAAPTRYRLRRETGRSWCIDRLVKRGGRLDWEPFKWGPVEAMVRLLFNLTMPSNAAAQSAADIAEMIRRAEENILKALTLAPQGVKHFEVEV